MIFRSLKILKFRQSILEYNQAIFTLHLIQDLLQTREVIHITNLMMCSSNDDYHDEILPVEEIVVLQFSAGQKEMRANYVNLHGR